MSKLENIVSLIPDYAKDIKLNLKKIIIEESVNDLNVSQLYGIALACAYAIKNKKLIEAIYEKATSKLSEAEIKAAQGSAAIMAMNNIYYRFIHFVSNDNYARMPANLRMNIIGNPGVEKTDFELMSLAVSAINGCGLCIDSHVKKIEKEGLSKKAIQSSIQIASVINAVAQVIEIEK